MPEITQLSPRLTEELIKHIREVLAGKILTPKIGRRTKSRAGSLYRVKVTEDVAQGSGTTVGEGKCELQVRDSTNALDAVIDGVPLFNHLMHGANADEYVFAKQDAFGDLYMMDWTKCCGTPDCMALHKQLSTDGTTFNTTDWSFSGTAPTVDAVDELTVGSGTFTPLFTMESNAAFSVTLKIRGSSGSTPQVKVHMGTETAVVDFGAETIQINSITAKTLPTHDMDQWQNVNIYFCPSHSMAETAGLVESSAHPDLSPVLPYSTETIDSANPTVSQSWTIEIVGNAEVSEFIYRPADVTYSGSTKTLDCGRVLFANNDFNFWNDHNVEVQSDGVQNINLTVTGSDTPLTAGIPPAAYWTGRFFGSNFSTAVQTQTNEPLDMAVLTAGGGSSLHLAAARNVKKYDGAAFVWEYRVQDFNFGRFNFYVECRYYIARDEPTSGTPYPEATARKEIRIGTINPLPPYNLTEVDRTTTDIGSIPDPVGTFTVSVTGACGGATDTTVEWDHPYP